MGSIEKAIEREELEMCLLIRRLKWAQKWTQVLGHIRSDCEKGLRAQIRQRVRRKLRRKVDWNGNNQDTGIIWWRKPTLTGPK